MLITSTMATAIAAAGSQRRDRAVPTGAANTDDAGGAHRSVPAGGEGGVPNGERGVSKRSVTPVLSVAGPLT